MGSDDAVERREDHGLDHPLNGPTGRLESDNNGMVDAVSGVDPRSDRSKKSSVCSCWLVY